MDMTTVFAPIMKTAPQPDGSILVYGKATGSDLDLDQQRCSPSWLARAVPEWFKIGNIREQHDPHRAVGKATEHDVREDGHYITAKIVDPVAKAKVEAGVFTGFSIGVKNYRLAKSADAPNGVIEDGRIVEVSIVDAPCLPTATLTVCKSATPGMEINAADFDEERGLVRCEELDENPSQPLVVKSARDIAAKENDVPTLAETLAPEALEKLAAVAEPTELPETPAAPAETLAIEKAAGDAPAETAGSDGGSETGAPAFDVDAAKALAADLLAKAEGDEMTDMAAVAPPSDEELAALAISIIARLIQSEAGDMVSNPGEDDDIRCLLSAIGSLRWYRRRERQEGDIGGVSDAAPYEYMAATPDTEKTVDNGRRYDLDDVLAEAGIDPADVDELATKAAHPAADIVVNLTDDQIAESVKTVTAANLDQLAPAAEKAAAPETTKAETVDSDGDALVKALSAALEKADSPLRNAFQNIVTASTETIAEALEDTRARLVKVENMAVPGGPALRRTEVERASARKSDLAGQIQHYRALAAKAEDLDLRTGYAAKAAQLETEYRALSA